MAMPQPNEPGTPEPGPDLDRLVEHLQSEEGHAQEAHLSSFESFELWLATHPGLQQPGIYELLSVYGPALLQVVRRMLGL